MRKRSASAALVVVAVCGLLTAGCSTPGPVHLYSVHSGASEISDTAVGNADVARDVPSFLNADDELTGFGYDPFTDHFFLRLAPGNHIRVVDRPARKIKLEFTIAGIPENTAGDLAISPRSGHIFLIDPHSPALYEATRLGELLRRVPLAGRDTPAAAVAFDMSRGELIVLDADGRRLNRYTTEGQAVSAGTLDHRVRSSLGYDAENHELYAPLVDNADTIGVFDDAGHMRRTIPIPHGDTFIDVGPHSFLRMF